ncbi:hypothetical protein JYG36_14490 [Pseudomonas sp. SORT22]|uniref:hypothetical protein n=1 Tax=unclassified Pseudomonas TaxID=196821 RepID=UPI00087E7A62|nr:MULTISPECIES: hypothetical protein [unclassified Pseudomonas]QVM94331.1 hypothetical protein JYG36_14490 [Pseudomonas sp. SORT22]SDQ71482.1 hypothetical protein SAMN05216487_3457 [Pseudomonas sp. UC 17F4]
MYKVVAVCALSLLSLDSFAAPNKSNTNYECMCIPYGVPPKIGDSGQPIRAHQCIRHPPIYQCGDGEIASCLPSDCKVGETPPIQMNHKGIATNLINDGSTKCTARPLERVVFNNLGFEKALDVSLGATAQEKCGLRFAVIGVIGWDMVNNSTFVEWRSKSGDQRLCENPGKQKVPVNYIKQGTPELDLSLIKFTTPIFLSDGSLTGECELEFTVESNSPSPLPTPMPLSFGTIGFTGPSELCGGTTGKEPLKASDPIPLYSIQEKLGVTISFKHSPKQPTSCRLRLAM